MHRQVICRVIENNHGEPFTSQGKGRGFRLGQSLVPPQAYFGIVVFGSRFVFLNTQAKLETPSVVERRHGHAFADKLGEAVGDVGYHGDVVNLVVVRYPEGMGNFKKGCQPCFMFTQNSLWKVCAQSDVPTLLRSWLCGEVM